MAYPIGIDLGTSNSVACVWRRGVVETVPVEGHTTFASVVSVKPDGTVLLGHAAKARALIEPGRSITSVKRHIGDGVTTWEIGGKTYTPVGVDALILGRLKQAAEDFLGEPVTEAVITVPAYFNNNQKRDTKAAGEAAGLTVLELLPEPTAAAISYGLDKGKDQTLLVYDLGGGTFDASVLRVKGNHFEAVAVDGDFHLGGDDFDRLLAEHLLDLLQKQTSSDLGPLRSLLHHMRGERELGTPQEILLARQQLKEAAEQAKIELSEADSTHVMLPGILGTSLDEEITLDTYNGLIAPLVDRTVAKIHDVLKSARLTAADIDRVILVGGSTRNRLVRARVAEAVKEPWISERVDEVVAQGAAIVAGWKAAPAEDLTPVPFTFSNVTPFSLGVRASKGSDHDFFKTLIQKNTPVAKAEAEEAFTTFKPNQTSVDISVYQGEEPHCKDNTFIGGIRLDGIPRGPAGEPKIVVRFKMDSSDLLTVSARCSSKSSHQTLDVNMVSREEDLTPAVPETDIMFLVDTSGSMSAELDGVKESGLAFANRVIQAGVACRLGLMDFDLPLMGTKYNWEVFGPMASEDFPSAISGLRIGRLGGCGCYVGNEDTIPVTEAFVKSFPDDSRLRIGILISDEVGNDAAATRRIVEILCKAGVTLHVLGVSGSCHERLAEETGGRFWDIVGSRGHVDFSDLLDAVASEITNLALP